MKRTQPKKEDPKFNPTQWMNDHPLFVAWWKDHPKSGYARRHGDGKEAWGIVPWQAYESDRFRAEYVGWSPDSRYNQEEIARLRKETADTKALTERLEVQLGRKFWLKPEIQTFGQVGQIYRQFRASLSVEDLLAIAEHAITGDEPKEFTASAMQARIDEAYEYEPGQSEEETRLLSRRREE